MRRGWWVAAGVLGLACTEKTALDAGTPAQTDAGLATHVTRCAERVPSELRDALLGGWNEQPVAALEGSDLEVCAFRKGAARVTLAFDCGQRPSDSQLSKMKDALLDPGGADLPGIGRAAVRAAVSRPDLEQITAWDADSPCTVVATWLGEGHEGTMELVRQLLDRTPPPAPPAAPGEPADAG